MAIIRVPVWGMDYSEAAYYGWRRSLHIGPFIVFWGMMSEAELNAWDDKWS